jgi:arylsulfatase A-like enzyme
MNFSIGILENCADAYCRLDVGAFPALPPLSRPRASQRQPNQHHLHSGRCLGYGDIGCFGQKQIKTPSLDQMAREGMRFTSVYAGSTVCAPSRCALMTGQHTGHCFIRGNSALALRPEVVTVAEVLKQAGYRTSLVGKWGLGLEGSTGVPGKKGFDEWFGYLDQHHAHDYYPGFLWRGDSQGTEVRVRL